MEATFGATGLLERKEVRWLEDKGWVADPSRKILLLSQGGRCAPDVQGEFADRKQVTDEPLCDGVRILTLLERRRKGARTTTRKGRNRGARFLVPLAQGRDEPLHAPFGHRVGSEIELRKAGE